MLMLVLHIVGALASIFLTIEAIQKDQAVRTAVFALLTIANIAFAGTYL